jgi:cytochrome c oxidase assembly protein subunit 15
MTYLLALGFGTTVSMWVIGYISRIPPVWMPSSVLLGLLLACLLGGGIVAGYSTGRGWKAGTQVGALASLLNMLVLGSLLSGPGANHVVASALWWIPGSLAAGAALGGIGGFVGERLAGGVVDGAGRNWTGGFAIVAASATFCLLVVGGIVTSERAGLSVIDWPNSYGYNMFLYPLSRMTGGVYFEHAHRLFGSLVGLTTLALAIHLWRVDRRSGIRRLGLVALGLVVFQGILGGLRVTGHFTMSDSPEETRPSTLLAIIHGATGQVFFATMVVLAAVTTRTWRSDRRPTANAGTADRNLSAALVGAILLQIVLGAILRQLSRGLLIHVTMAVFVVILGVATGVRAAALRHGQPILERLGRAVLWILTTQVLLGILALMARLMSPEGEVTTVGVILRTAHQAMGAILLGSSVLLAAWSRRLLEVGLVPAEQGDRIARSASPAS